MADPSRSFAYTLWALVACSLPHALTAVPAGTADPRGTAEAIRAGVQLDAAGRVVYHPDGGRRLYTSDPALPAPAPPPPELRAPRLPGRTVTAGGLEISLEWYRAVFGTGIGYAGLVVADLDDDGAAEITAGASPNGFWGNRYWYVLEPEGGGYRQRWTSLPYDAELDRLVVAQLDQDSAEEVLIAGAGHLFVYDGQTFELEAEHPTASGPVWGLATADLDGDPALEAVVCDESDAWIYDLGTGVLQLPLPGYGCYDLAIGETDGTAGLEIVIAGGASGWVLDGASGAVEWNHPLGLGDRLALGDLDGDGRDEIAAGFSWSGIQVWHGDTHGFAWEVPVFNLATLIAVDVEGDGDVELVYGDAQWGDVHVLNGANGSEQWSVPNPEHGVTRIAVGDVDQDGVREVFFGAGFSSTGPDYLFVVDGVTHAIEWQSTDVSGPFYGLAHGDVDADGAPELVYTSFESDSGYGDGLYFVHDARTKQLEYQSSESTGNNWTGLWKVQLADVDLDPAAEIFLPTGYTYEGVLQCLDGVTHDLQWEATLVSGLTLQSLRLGDPDGDGETEVAAGVEVQHTGAPGVYVYLYDAATGSPEWQSPNLQSFFGFWAGLGLLRIADVDDDGTGELVVAARGGGLMSLDPVAGSIDLAVPGIEVTALDTPDLDGDGIPEIVVGTLDGVIAQIDPLTGAPTVLAGPFGAQIDGLARVDLTGDSTADWVFAAGDRVHLVDGATLLPEWVSEDLGTGVGRSDSLLVADLDADGTQEIWVNAGPIGHFVFGVLNLVFADGFESGDTSAWSAVVQ
jgi:hypothetical protein